MATFGAYIIEDHPDGEPLFNMSRRDPSKDVPEAQAKVEREARALISKILATPVKEDIQNLYITLIKGAFRKGCVRENPNPRDALRDLKEISNKFVSECLANRISNRQTWYLIWAGISLIVSLVLSFVALAGYFSYSYLDQNIISHYAFVWAAAMAAVIVNDAVVKNIKDVDVYWELERKLSRPFVSVIATGFVAVAFAIGLSQEAVSFKIGSLKSSEVSSSVQVALLCGFLTGLISSDLVKALVAKIRRGLVS